MTALNATLEALKRLETVGQAGQTAKQTNAIESRIKIVDPVRDEWKTLQNPIDLLGLPVGFVGPSGGTWTGVQDDWDGYEASMRSTQMMGVAAADAIQYGVSLNGAHVVRCELGIVDAQLTSADMLGFYHPDSNEQHKSDWRRFPAIDWSVTEALVYGGSLAGVPGVTLDFARVSSPIFPVLFPRGRVMWIARNVVHTGTGKLSFYAESF